MQVQEQLKSVGDALSLGTVLATIAGFLPAIAALFTIVWTGLRIYESPTIQKWLNRET